MRWMVAVLAVALAGCATGMAVKQTTKDEVGKVTTTCESKQTGWFFAHWFRPAIKDVCEKEKDALTIE